MGVEEERAAREMPVLEANDKTQSNIDVREHRCNRFRSLKKTKGKSSVWPMFCKRRNHYSLKLKRGRTRRELCRYVFFLATGVVQICKLLKKENFCERGGNKKQLFRHHR